jgi:hypothetical protein
MKVSSVFLLAACMKSAEGEDDFNYRETQGRDYGPNDWDEVSCDNLETCVSYTIPAYDLYHRSSYTHSYCDLYTSLDGPTSILDRSDFNSQTGPTIASGVRLKATVAVSIVNHLLTCNVIVLIPIVPTPKSVQTGIGTFLNMMLSSDGLFHYYGNSHHSHVFPRRLGCTSKMEPVTGRMSRMSLSLEDTDSHTKFLSRTMVISTVRHWTENVDSHDWITARGIPTGGFFLKPKSRFLVSTCNMANAMTPKLSCRTFTSSTTLGIMSERWPFSWMLTRTRLLGTSLTSLFVSGEGWKKRVAATATCPQHPSTKCVNSTVDRPVRPTTLNLLRNK